jgi:hypothetical protein
MEVPEQTGFLIISIPYAIIVLGLAWMIVKSLMKGEVEQLVAGRIKLYNIQKYKSKNGVLIIKKSQFPKQFWTAIFFRILFLALALYLGYLGYNEIMVRMGN